MTPTGVSCIDVDTGLLLVGVEAVDAHNMAPHLPVRSDLVGCDDGAGCLVVGVSPHVSVEGDSTYAEGLLQLSSQCLISDVSSGVDTAADCC